MIDYGFVTESFVVAYNHDKIVSLMINLNFCIDFYLVMIDNNYLL